MKRFIKHFTLLASLMLLAQIGFGQRLLIQYDFLNDDMHYFKVKANGKRVSIDRPVVTRGRNVKVEVINYNPFVYSALASYKATEYEEAPNLDFLSMMSPLGLPTGGSSFLSMITTGENESSRSASAVSAMGDEARTAFKNIEDTYNTLYKAEQMMNNIDFILDKVNKLKYNPYLPSDSIKAFTQELLQSLFKQPAVETKDFLTMANNLNSTVKGDLAFMRSNIATFDAAYTKFASSQRSAVFEGMGLDKVVKTWGEQASTFVKEFDSDLLIEKLDALEMIYQSIMNTPYSFNTNDIAEGDHVTITIDFYRNPESTPAAGTSVADLPKVKTKEIEVTVKGDVKVNSSFGLSFPYYQDNNEYINKDSLITSIVGNNFTPNIAAYLNFYPYTGRNVQFGGTFGVGVPISADSKNFNFLLGMSTIFGDQNRIVLNYGATLGQVKRIDQGFEVGDNLGDLLSPVPTRSAYQVGAFVGVSFSLVSIKE